MKETHESNLDRLTNLFKEDCKLTVHPTREIQ